MGASYFASRVVANATFSLFVRNGHANRNYFVAAGLEDVLDELAAFHFSESDIRYLRSTELFPDEFLSYLARVRFSGSVTAMPEGTIFFANEPVLEITAPIIEAQLVETFLLNTVGFQTMIASKAARCVHAAGGRPLIDFSLRRTQGQDAGIKVARNSYLAGFSSTSNVLAGKHYAIPIAGTMAHSYVQAFADEIEAFSAYADAFPEHTILLIDTYDTIAGAKNAVLVAKAMQKKGNALIGVRLDSGDMTSLSQQVRTIFDDAGLADVEIYASSGFDEFKIARCLDEAAEIDAFGVGTNVGVSSDAPFLDVVYKMVRFDDRPVKKLSPGKITLAGAKQVYRRSDQKGIYLEDIVGVRDDAIAEAVPLLENVMENGKPLRPHPSLSDLRDRFKKNFSLLDDKYKSIHDKVDYPVRLSKRLQDLQK
jgi:nicotinate phosphoribosyltransferase